MDVPVLHHEMIGDGSASARRRCATRSTSIMCGASIRRSPKCASAAAQVAFLLEPTPIDDMARIAFGGGVMPQKSTDFYPKLLTGVAIYKL